MTNTEKGALQTNGTPLQTSPIGLACDHAGFPLMQAVIRHLDSLGIPYKNYGTLVNERCDYADFAHCLGDAIDNGIVTRGIAICGSGEGIGMTLNHHPKVRAALCWRLEICALSRIHNDANVLVMPGRFISELEAQALIDCFLNTPFEGGRHIPRIQKIPLQ